MDRLSRVALVLALVFVGSWATLSIAESRLQLWAFLALLSSGLGLLLLSFGRIFELLGDWLRYSAYPLFITAMAGVIAFVVPFGEIAELFRSPRILAGSCEHTVAFTHIVLRQDGTAEYTDIMWGRDVKHGKYSVDGDTVFLAFSDKLPVPSKLLLLPGALREIKAIDSTRERLWSFRLYINKLSPQ